MNLEDRATTTYDISLPYTAHTEFGDLARYLARALAEAGINGKVIPVHGTWEGAVEDGATVVSQEDVPVVLRELGRIGRAKWVHVVITDGVTGKPTVRYVDLDKGWRT